MKILPKIFSLALLITTAWLNPSEAEPDYYDYGYDYSSHNYYEPMAPVPEFQMGPQLVLAEEGQMATIPCQLQEETPYVTIIKKEDKGSSLLFVGAVKVIRDRRFSLEEGMMTISNLKRSDAGTYKCELSISPPKELSHELDVLYVPEIKVMTEGERRVFHKGDSAKLVCQANGNPTPTTKWSRQEGRLPSGNMEEEGMNLSLVEMDRHDEGTYVCTADNGIGQPVYESISVVVEYPPEVLTKKYMVRNGDEYTVELVCLVYARPPPTINWTKDGALIGNSGQTEEQQNGGHHYNISISQFSEANFREYACTAENKFGFAESVVTLNADDISTLKPNEENGVRSNTASASNIQEQVTRFQRLIKSLFGDCVKNQNLWCLSRWMRWL